MRCRICIPRFVLAAALLAASLSSAWAQDSGHRAVLVSHPVLAASVERLSVESPTWRDALSAVAATGRRTVLLTSDKVNGTFDSEALAQAHPLADDQARVETVLVVINLELLQRLSGLPVDAIQFKDDLDRIVAHEVYGHAVPFLLAGDLSGRCADPAPGQSATSACAIKRENLIRKEVGLGQRFEYGREGLAIARRYWQ
jgi:hypothetical protein